MSTSRPETMRTGRTDRAQESRLHEEKEGRTFYNNEYKSILDIPDHVKKPGYEYYWGRRSLKGQMDISLELEYSKGWRPVEASRDKNSFSNLFVGADDVSKAYICKADCILLEREVELGVQERQNNEDTAIRMAKESNAYNFKDTDPTANALRRD